MRDINSALIDFIEETDDNDAGYLQFSSTCQCSKSKMKF